MAEAVVGLLVGKLSVVLANEAAAYGASLLCKEASALNGLFDEIRKAEAELKIMKAYLYDTEKFKDTNETTSAFVKEIRGLTFRIEDVVDEFTYNLEDKKHGGFTAKVKKRVNHVKVWRRLASELHDINVKLEDAAKRRDRYAIPGIEGHTRGCDRYARSTHQMSCLAREEDLVGIEDNADKLKQWLVGDLEENRNKTVSVWGMGGAGKTTLVHHVYRAVKEAFDTVAWVTVSKNYQVEDLLKKIAREFGIITDASNMEMISVVEVIRNHLEGKKYILVLDDVWEKDVWINNIMAIFPANCTSRFVLTSRNYEVASLATNNCAIKLERLEDSNSWKLFCKLVFQNNDDKRCPPELQDLAAKFLQKCDGLPIAIACIGRLLSCKPATYPAWKNLYEELLRSSKNVIPNVDVIIKSSLEDLPYELKNCLLHCAIFPEDHELKRRRLLRHWITAGFIKGTDNKTMEQVAEGYLYELINRSLLQVVEKNEFGRVKSCRMHDIIRQLALEKSKIECFGTIYDGSKTFSVDITRRLSIHSSNIAPLSQSSTIHLRSIYAFAHYVDLDILRPILASTNLLSTLDLQGTQIEMLPNEVFSLFNLRFLGLGDTRIHFLPEAVGRLQNLEVLDASNTALLSLPKDVAKLKKLRYLYASVYLMESGSYRRIRGVKMPRGIKNLTGLHALQDVKASLEALDDVAALTELRTFAVKDVKSEHSLNLCSAIVKMSHLVHLTISASSENEVLPWEALHLPGTLSKLKLDGQLEKQRLPQILSSWSHLNTLTRLSLGWSKLDEDSFSSLTVLRGLCYLSLNKAYDGDKLYFPAQSFPKLRQLIIWTALQLRQVEIEEGALESLVELWFSECPEWKHLPHGIEYLTGLEELYLKDTAEELVEKLKQESEANGSNKELTKIGHIRKVVVIVTEKNIWERIR
ncbi:hypothetical protein ACP70R_004100 [Stipagrostis hirtigluma subsp. patula]